MNRTQLLCVGLIAVASIVSVAQAEGVPAGAKISWLAGGQYFYDAPRFRHIDIRKTVNDAIEEVLTAKGFQFEADPAAGDYLVGYTLVLEDLLDDAAREVVFLRDPSLGALGLEDRNFENGVVAAKILEARTRRVLWSRSVRGFAVLDLPEDVRKRRVLEAAEAVFESLHGGQ